MYKDRLTFFIDILGFKEMIIKTETDIELEKSLFNVLLSVTSDNLKQNAVGNINHKKIPEEEKEIALKVMEKFSQNIIKEFDIKATQFSDCLVFSVPIENEIACFTIFEAVAKLMTTLHIKHKLLLRGGVAMGQLCHQEAGPLFGPALVEAYEIESQNAIYPRVLLSSQVSNGVMKTEQHKFMLSLFEQQTGQLYISLATAYDYLFHISTVFNKQELKENFFISKNFISQEAKRDYPKKVIEKYKWLYCEMEKLVGKFS